ncbi:MAG: hypothetical protein AAB817_01075, partial [Patescibacteria group bacterium]
MPPIDFTADFFELLRSAGGYYECPKDRRGKRLGPLVAYTAKALDEHGRRFVGDHFVNCAAIERRCPMELADLLERWCRQHLLRLINVPSPEDGLVWCGVPRGGVS